MDEPVTRPPEHPGAAAPHGDPRQDRPPRGRERVLRRTAVLPGLATLLNLLSGFAAVHFASKDALGQAQPENLLAAAWLIFAAMAFDMLDGRLARMTRRTSDFGGQLDSLADIVSFGVAPAMLMLRTVVTVLRGQISQIPAVPPHLATQVMERLVWAVAAVYLACATLRLARFNVENLPDESAHMSFHGLPSPAAAALEASLVLLFEHLQGISTGWRSSPWLLRAVGTALPVATLLSALLMVSRFKYLHIVNQYVRGRRPFGYLVKLVIIIPAVLLEPYVTAVVVVVLYAISGPMRWLWWRRRWAAQAPPTAPPA